MVWVLWILVAVFGIIAGIVALGGIVAGVEHVQQKRRIAKANSPDKLTTRDLLKVANKEWKQEYEALVIKAEECITCDHKVKRRCQFDILLITFCQVNFLANALYSAAIVRYRCAIFKRRGQRRLEKACFKHLRRLHPPQMGAVGCVAHDPTVVGSFERVLDRDGDRRSAGAGGGINDLLDDVGGDERACPVVDADELCLG